MRRELVASFARRIRLYSSSYCPTAAQLALASGEAEYHAKKYKLKADSAEYDLYGTREITEYATFTVGVHLWARGVKNVEVIKDGEKVKMH